MNNIEKTVTIALIISCLFMVSCTDNSDEYKNFSASLSEEVLSANIILIPLNYEANGEDGVSSSISYGANFSGVIFEQLESTYYALTAYHAVDDWDNSEFIILTYNVPLYKDLEHEEHIGLSAYYEQFPRAKLEYYDETYDLAIISFESNAVLYTLDISEMAPQYGDNVTVISSPDGEERNMITFGKITSQEPVEFGDEEGKTQHKIVEHSAYENAGSSGSVLLNEELLIIGINLGGRTNCFGKFICGMAMPSDKIIDFINGWSEN